MKHHASITIERVMDACVRRNTTLDNPGFCMNCGEEADSCESDAREHLCESCDEPQVYGAEEILMMIA